MDQEVARLRHQLEEAERRQNEAERRQNEAERRRTEAERRLEPNSLFGLLEGCHSLSQAIRVETNATLTTQGDATNPANRLFPKRIVPFP